MSRRVLVPVLAVILAAPLAAQEPVPMPETYRATQLSMLRLQRRAILAMADSMPEALYADKATPVQRSFAEQLVHAAGAVPFVMGRVGNPIDIGSASSQQAIASREALRAFVNAVYDAAERNLQAATAEQRATSVNLFGNTMPLWQVWDEIHQHTFWTLGQVVANFRNHGMAPPGFGFF
jgi:hypothetical protein